jgi:hypothetical protein
MPPAGSLNFRAIILILTLKGCNKNYILISIAQHKLIKFMMKSFRHLHETGGAYLLDDVDL